MGPRQINLVAEYLHGLAIETFIHRDLMSSNNVLLGGGHVHAKVSDFGLVKLVPDGGKSAGMALL